MQELFDLERKKIDISRLELLSDRGSECVVYKYGDRVVKLFKKDYCFSHLSVDEVKFLRQINTERILLPMDAVLDDKNSMIGYQMPLMTDEKDIKDEKMNHVLDEMRFLKKDIEILSLCRIGLIDLSVSNTIYNGKVYLIDPGNYTIGDVGYIKHDLDPFDLRDDELSLVREWNYGKMNVLFDDLLFLGNKEIDAYKHRFIIQFFQREREGRGINYNLEIFEDYFDPELSAKEATKQFIKDHLKEDPEEKKLFLSLYEK